MLSIEKQVLFLLSRTKRMDTQDLIRIYEKRNYSPQSIRNTLSHLKKEGYVLSPSRSSYEITESGRSFIKSINQKPLLYGHVWDHRWHLVMVGIPETERRKRDQFRTDILQVGFGLLYNSVYIAPWDYSEEVSQLIHKHGIGGKATMFEGSIQNREISPEEAVAIWQLDAVDQKYRKQWDWFVREFQPQMRHVLESGSSADPLDTFLLYLTIGEVVSDLYLTDPMLPPELLPDSWKGKHILQELQQQAQSIVQAIPAGSFYAQFV